MRPTLRAAQIQMSTAIKRKRSPTSLVKPTSSPRPRLASTSRTKAKLETSPSLTPPPRTETEDQEERKPGTDADAEKDGRLANKKYDAYSPYISESPFPTFIHPTPEECRIAHRVLKDLHQDAVDQEFNDENTPETIPHVLDAMIVAVLSQATGWSNAKRAMNSMKKEYGSVFAYDKIMEGGKDKLTETIRCGGMHNRKSMIITTILNQVKERHGKYDLDSMFNLDDGEVMKELLSYKYIGTKSASVVTGWCLKRNPFTVDTHVYRIAGLWGWRPKDASREKTQSHLEVMIPPNLKFDLHFLLIQHGRSCPACRGGSKGGACTFKARAKEMKEEVD